MLLSKIEEESKSEVQNSMRSSRKAATKVNSPKGIEGALKGDLSILPFSKVGTGKRESVTSIEELKITPNTAEASAIEKHKELFIEVLLRGENIGKERTYGSGGESLQDHPQRPGRRFAKR